MDKITLNLSIRVRDDKKEVLRGISTDSMLMAFVHRMRVEWNLYQAECEEKYSLPANAVDFDMETDVPCKK